jgi:hypothetical protein
MCGLPSSFPGLPPETGASGTQSKSMVELSR